MDDAVAYPQRIRRMLLIRVDCNEPVSGKCRHIDPFGLHQQHAVGDLSGRRFQVQAAVVGTVRTS